MNLDTETIQRLIDLSKQAAQAHAQIAALLSEQLSPGPAAVAQAAGEIGAASKPEPIRITVAGIDMSALGLGKSGSAVAWQGLINHPPFQMFMSECGFPNPDGKNTVELAVDFIMAQSKTKSELQFYAEYVSWFKKKGYWPGESPTGQLIGEG